MIPKKQKEVATADYQATAAKRKAAEKELQMFCNQTGRHPIGRYFFCSDNKKSAARSNGFPILHAGGRFAADADIGHFCTNSKTAENA